MFWNHLNPEPSRRRHPEHRVLKGLLKRSPLPSDTSNDPSPLLTTHISGGRQRGQWGPRWWWRARRRSWLGRFPGRSSGTSYPVWNEWSRSFCDVVLQHNALGLLTHLGTEGEAGSWAQAKEQSCISSKSHCTVTTRGYQVRHHIWVKLQDKTLQCTK